MTRTDLHRPSSIIPADYDFVACDYYGSSDEEDFRFERRAFRAHMEKTGGTLNQNQTSGTCHICGAAAMYVAKYHHTPSNTYIVTGMDCAMKMDIGHPEAFKSFRKRVAKVREFARGQRRGRNVLVALGMSVALELYDATDKKMHTKDERIITDLVGKLVQYGSLSDRQVSFMDKLICGRAPEKVAAQAQVNAAKIHLGTVGARIELELTVAYTTSWEGHFGTTFLYIMNDAAGNVVVYKGSKDDLGAKGETVKVRATVKEHGDREGVKQTIITRPAVMVAA